MDFVSPIITPIVESLMAPVKKHLGFFFSSTNHVAEMNDGLLVLKETADGVKRKQKGNKDNTLVIPSQVPRWLEEVETINEEAGKISTNGNGCFNNIKLRYKAGKESLSILKKINDLINQESKIKWTNEQIALGRVSSSTMEMPSTSERHNDDDGTQHIVMSRRIIFKEVLKSLEPNSKSQMMALCGMGGVGKTTMMEEIKKVVEKRGMFKWVLKVVVGQKSDPIAIQQAIAQYMGEPLTETTKEARADRLGKKFRAMLENDTKILIILDDVWEEIDLKDIGVTTPLPNGFKFLFTSRDEKVCIKMNVETSSIFKIDGLEEVEANLLFWDIVKLSHGDNELKKIGEDILKICGGLPIAIKTIALTLRGEKKDAWMVALLCLQRHDFKDLYDITDGIFEISYNNLRKDDDKAIFIICGLYPDDFDISIEELVRYGWGLKVFNKAYSLLEARQRTNMSVQNLIRANLLTGSNIVGCVRMHDLARTFVLCNISKFKQASIINHANKSEWPTPDTRDTCDRVLLKCTGMSGFPQCFNYPNLVLLKLMEGDKLLKFPDDFYKRMEKLEVIAYDEMYSPLLSVSFQSSTNLRTLCLYSCVFIDNDISCLGDLISLEILSVAYCRIKKLPSKIGNLKRLKLLDLTGCSDLLIDDGVFQNLENLEELYMRGSSVRFTNANCDELEALSRKLYAFEVEFFENNLESKRLSFKKLQRFRISIGCRLQWKSYDTKDKYYIKNTLKLETNISDLLESKLSELFSKTEELHLSVKDMSYVEDIAMSPLQHSTFSNLIFLHIFNCLDLSCLFTIHVANGLKKLEHLIISSCPVLKSVVSLCDSANVMELPQLVELKLCDLPDFTSIIRENDISETQPLFNKEVLFPKLRKLKVRNLKKLKRILASDITSGEEDNLSMLRKIKVDGCDCLVNLFPKNPMRVLSHLEELRVRKCCSIEVLFNIDLGKIEQLRDNNNLRKIEVVELEELRELWRINEENNPGHLIRCFQAVETINIKGCMKFRNVFTPETANFDIGALKDICITYNEVEEAEITGISKLRERPKVACPYYHLTHTFHHLQKISFNMFKGVEVMFEMESSSINRELTTQQPPLPLPLLPYLQELELTYMDTLSHVWKCNIWSEFFILHKHQQQSSFQNLTTIHLNNCKRIKYLFSPLMSKLLSGLKNVKIVNCEAMEEVVSNRDDEDEVLTKSTTNLFPCLDLIHLSNLHNLEHIGGGFAEFSQGGVGSWSLCQYAIKIKLYNCFALSSVIPSYAAPQMQKLQELEIWYGSSMVEVFETKEINNNGCSIANIDQEIVALSRPKNITMHHELPNLKKLHISWCPILEYVFTFSTLESLKKLENLSIWNCEAMKVIVREENGVESSKVVLPRLKSIQLRNLPSLAGFFLGMNIDFQLPSLADVRILNCPRMMVFTNGEAGAPKLKYIGTVVGRYHLECGLNFHEAPPPSSDSSSMCPVDAKRTPWSVQNLIELKPALSFRFKNILLNEWQQPQNLEKVNVYYNGDVEEVFEVASLVTNNASQTVVKFPKLTEVELKYLNKLKCIWKSNRWITLEFPNLTRLYINSCDKLEHVFTASMLGSLMQLQQLRIKRCEHIEVIVKKEEECDGKASEIILPCLKSLEFIFLPSLKAFCFGNENFTLPSLESLVIERCPEIRYFSEGCAIAPELKLVETGCGTFLAGEDVNSFIKIKKQEGNIFLDEIM